VRIIGRPDDVLVTDLLHYLFQAAFLLRADKTLPHEVRARLHGQGWGVPFRQTLEVVIDAIEPERHPAGIAFEQGDA
jgi:hypothetical protein